MSCLHLINQQLLMASVQEWVSKAGCMSYPHILTVVLVCCSCVPQPQLQQQLALLGLDKEGTRVELVERLHAAQAARSPAAAQDVPSRSSLRGRRKVRTRPGHTPTASPRPLQAPLEEPLDMHVCWLGSLVDSEMHRSAFGSSNGFTPVASGRK